MHFKLSNIERRLGLHNNHFLVSEISARLSFAMGRHSRSEPLTETDLLRPLTKSLSRSYLLVFV